MYMTCDKKQKNYSTANKKWTILITVHSTCRCQVRLVANQTWKLKAGLNRPCFRTWTKSVLHGPGQTKWFASLTLWGHELYFAAPRKSWVSHHHVNQGDAHTTSLELAEHGATPTDIQPPTHLHVLSPEPHRSKWENKFNLSRWLWLRWWMDVTVCNCMWRL